ncbi:MAG: hypothetical protein COV07_00130 [Candidatus Vogelbacteria bacterium CG10_big_fil_rev_8_21_14_0_10_45_14]|uniref:LysM domain-containing protein n=1 Tax=Candidatus Vogelbacteria bacterium CG10_big_fil_rev_8_21_14_0_10_45_14 TaxID=1975042 RepID=A0A2H0RL84_9BACT|nr:MAG: hypothetical protein COV07_00130 [Candidatus Vogelbacteria bacterium CG10_big_fil_rev_8_21_14_0_10_45_14]
MTANQEGDDSSSKPLKKTSNRAVIGTLVILGFIVLSVPTLTEAGPGSNGLKTFISDILLRAEVSAEVSVERYQNSQTLALLAPEQRPLGEISRGGGDITIIEGTSLLAESGPMGTAADMDGSLHDEGNINIYVVREGDTISEIAEMFNVTTNTVRWANNLTSNTLKSGQVLLILPVSGVSYKVLKGDTLSTIAKKMKGDEDEISRYNGLATGAKLSVGETLIIPNGVVEAATKKSPIASKVASKSNSGYYSHPLPGARRTQGIHGWNGVDLASYAGAPIKAAAGGQVLVARTSGWNGGYGNYVVISHSNGTQTLYAHLSKTAVTSGANVSKGQVIGYEGSTGRSTGPHLHFEVRGAKNPF